MVIADIAAQVTHTDCKKFIRVKEGLCMVLKVMPMIPAFNTRMASQIDVKVMLEYVKRTCNPSTRPKMKNTKKMISWMTEITFKSRLLSAISNLLGRSANSAV